MDVPAEGGSYVDVDSVDPVVEACTCFQGVRDAELKKACTVLHGGYYVAVDVPASGGPVVCWDELFEISLIKKVWVLKVGDVVVLYLHEKVFL